MEADAIRQFADLLLVGSFALRRSVQNEKNSRLVMTAADEITEIAAVLEKISFRLMQEHPAAAKIQ